MTSDVCHVQTVRRDMLYEFISTGGIRRRKELSVSQGRSKFLLELRTFQLPYKFSKTLKGNLASGRQTALRVPRSLSYVTMK
jgi:hypothetical protein